MPAWNADDALQVWSELPGLPFLIGLPVLAGVGVEAGQPTAVDDAGVDANAVANVYDFAGLNWSMAANNFFPRFVRLELVEGFPIDHIVELLVGIQTRIEAAVDKNVFGCLMVTRCLAQELPMRVWNF